MPQFSVGLDIGHFSIKLLRLRSGFRSVELEDFQQVPIPLDDRPWHERAAEALSQVRNIRPQDIVASAIAGDEIGIRLLGFPFSDRRRIQQTIGFELESQVPYSLQEAVFDYRVCRSTHDSTQVLACIVLKEKLERWLELLNKAGIDPRFLGPGSLATASIAGFIREEENWPRPLAMLDIGHRLTDLVVVGEQDVEFARTITGGGEQVLRRLADEFNVSEERALQGIRKGLAVETSLTPLDSEEMVKASGAIKRALGQVLREARQSLTAYRSIYRRQPELLVLCGDGSNIRNLPEHLAEELGLPVQPLEPSSLDIPDADRLAEHGRGWSKALGLALHAHMGGQSGFLNVRKGDFAFKGDFEMFRGRLKKLAAALVILLVLVVGDITVRWLSLSATQSALDRQIEHTTRSILGRSYSDLEVALSIMREKISPAANPLPSVTALDVLREIHERIPEQTKVRLKEVNITPKRVHIVGYTESFESVEKIRAGLEQFKCFTDVQTGKTQKTTKGDEVEFRFTIAFGC